MHIGSQAVTTYWWEAIFSVSNGYLGNICMMNGPKTAVQKVTNECTKPWYISIKLNDLLLFNINNLIIFHSLNLTLIIDQYLINQFIYQ